MKRTKLHKKGIFAGVFIFSILFCTHPSFAESSIWVDPSTGRITVRATREQMKNIEEILPTLPTTTRQIRIEARIVEVSGRIAQRFGTYLERLTGLEVPIGPLGEGSRLAYGPRTLAELAQGEGKLEFSFFKLSLEERFELALNMLLTEGKAEILSNPRVVTLSGEVAGVFVTTEVPYLSSITYETIDDRRIPIEHYDYATVGIVLQVLPRIVGEDLVEMSIIPLVGNYEITPEFGAQHPIFKRQVSPTNVTVKDGESLVIGGLISKEKTRQTIGLPVLSHLPILGSLFRSQIDTVEDKNLIITIKPHILKPREIEGRVKKVFHFTYARAEEIADKIREVTSPHGSVEVNPMEAPPNSVVVRDREDRIHLIQTLVNQIGTFEEQKRQKIYRLTFTPVEGVRAVVENLLSAEGSLVLMREENAILIADGAYQLSIIDSAIFVLEEYNSSFQKKFLFLSHISPSEAIQEISSFISPRGDVKPVGDKMIVVEDNRLVIQRVEEELKKIDVPQR
ncbi:hypothetical protein IBX65_01385 [Candidatus Aerophobetes bacterium]|nr:hypothetical protein [Candidatus Aerophobetes bacterium]